MRSLSPIPPSQLCCSRHFALAIGEDFLIEHNYECVARPGCCDIEKAFKFLLLGALDRVFQILDLSSLPNAIISSPSTGDFTKCG